MSITRTEFDILTCLEKTKYHLNQFGIVEYTKIPLETVNKSLLQLREYSYISDDNFIKEEGLQALEPYRVNRAIFIAAGTGSRMVPITINTPKPLVRIKGIRIIDTLLDAVIAAGIEDIVIVRGYLGEQFDQLRYKYPQVKFLENPFYMETNNISSLVYAEHLLQNTYILESDLFLYNTRVITKYQYASNYLGVPVKKTDDLCFMSKGNYIIKLQVGGLNCHHMYGISYWTKSDGARLAMHIKQFYEMPGGKECYWDQVPLEFFAMNYNVEIRECSFDDIVEIDTYSELKTLDDLYK